MEPSGGTAAGPLVGVKVVELGSIGPAPFAGMLLSDMGAEVVRIDRVSEVGTMAGTDRVSTRGRRAVAIDLQQPDGLSCARRLVDQADALIDPYRPGVLERLGLGPDECLARNPRLVFGRMTGWGQEGPLAQSAGHDINYIALAGALAHFGRAGGKPTPPINMVGDYGGGGALLAFGIVCGIFETRTSGEGQVIDVAMVDGAASLMAIVWGMRALGAWNEDLGTNLLDTGAPFYDTYETKDGRYVSIGPIERPFFAELVERTGFTGDDVATRNDPATWPAKKAVYEELFLSKTRDEWCELLEGTDVCFAPVLPMSEAARHPHLVARGTIIEVDGVQQPAPAPRFSRTPGAIRSLGVDVGAHTDAALADWGFTAEEIAALHQSGATAQA
ncbi:MAG: CaiB/BaiF CoA transferase family protein [Acidimicrobiia bacterium]